MSESLIIAVVGDGQCDDGTAAEAEAVGRALAEAGVTVVCGLDRRSANPHVDFSIVTGMGQARNLIVVRTGHAVIAVRGQYGTLSEIAHALKAGIPVVGLGTWELNRPGESLDVIRRARRPGEAVKLAIELARRRAGG